MDCVTQRTDVLGLGQRAIYNQVSKTSAKQLSYTHTALVLFGLAIIIDVFVFARHILLGRWLLRFFDIRRRILPNAFLRFVVSVRFAVIREYLPFH